MRGWRYDSVRDLDWYGGRPFREKDRLVVWEAVGELVMVWELVVIDF